MQQDNIINWDLRQWGGGGGVVSNTEIRLLMKFFYWYSCIPQDRLSWIHTPSFLLITQLYTDVYPFSDTCVMLLWVYCFSPLCSAYSARLLFALFTRIFYYLAYIPWYNMITLIYFLWSTLSNKYPFVTPFFLISSYCSTSLSLLIFDTVFSLKCSCSTTLHSTLLCFLSYVMLLFIHSKLIYPPQYAWFD